METNIIHFSVFVPALSPGSYIAEHTYIKCSAVAAENIIQAVSDINETMLECLQVVRFLCGKYGTIIDNGKRDSLLQGYSVIPCNQKPPTLDMFLLNGFLNGPRLSHVVCFVTDRDGMPVECTIYKLGEVRVPDKDAL